MKNCVVRIFGMRTADKINGSCASKKKNRYQQYNDGREVTQTITFFSRILINVVCFSIPSDIICFLLDGVRILVTLYWEILLLLL